MKRLVPRNITELISRSKAMEPMIKIIKMDLPTLHAAAREDERRPAPGTTRVTGPSAVCALRAVR